MRLLIWPAVTALPNPPPSSMAFLTGSPRPIELVPGTGIGHYFHLNSGGSHHHGSKGSASDNNRLEVGADVHSLGSNNRKKFSFSSERLSETVSLSERSATVSLADDGGNSAAASTRALAGSLLAYKVRPNIVFL